MARPKKVVQQPEQSGAETKTEVAEPLVQQPEKSGAKFRYRVTNSRIGHEIGRILTYDHEPNEVFLACLERVE